MLKMISEEEYNCIYKKFSDKRSGILFMKRDQERLDLALRVIQDFPKFVDIVIWIAPAAYLLSKNYIRNIRRSRKRVTGKFYFFSIEAISISNYKYLRVYSLIDKYRAVAVIDEGITIKNTEAGRTSRLLFLARKFKFRLILSSIPLTQGLIDLYSQLQFMNPTLLKMTESQFTNIFLPYHTDAHPITRRWSTTANEKKLVKMIEPYILLYNLDMKENFICKDFICNLSKKEVETYKLEKENFINSRKRIGFLELVQKFQYVYTMAESKIYLLEKIVNDIVQKGEKVIVFVKYVDEIILIEECGILKDIKYSMLCTNKKRRATIEQFKKESDVLLCTYGAGGANLSLEFCNNIIYFSQTFDYRNKLQSIKHLCSEEQKKQVNVYNFWVDTGLDSLIRESQKRKENVLKNICGNMNKLRIMGL